MPKEKKYKYLRAWGLVSYIYIIKDNKQLFITLMKAGLCQVLLRQFSIKKVIFTISDRHLLIKGKQSSPNLTFFISVSRYITITFTFDPIPIQFFLDTCPLITYPCSVIILIFAFGFLLKRNLTLFSWVFYICCHFNSQQPEIFHLAKLGFKTNLPFYCRILLFTYFPF